MEDNSNRLPILAAEIKDHMMKATAGREAWAEGKLNAAIRLAEARALFPNTADIEFGKWLKTNGVKIDKDERAALIAMGQDPARMKAVLATTERTSIRYIFAQEWTLRYAAKGAPTPKSGAAHHKDTPATDKAFEHIVTAKATGTKVPGKKQLAKELGVSHMAVEKAMDRLDQNPDAGTLPPAGAVLSKSAQDKLDAYRRKLEREFEMGKERWRAQEREQIRRDFVEMNERADNGLRERLQYLELVAYQRGGVFSKKEFLMVKTCLHPDSRNSTSEEKLAEAFRLFSDAEKFLLKVEPLGAPIKTRTAEEMMASAAKYEEERRVKARKAAAARKAKKEQTSAAT